MRRYLLPLSMLALTAIVLLWAWSRLPQRPPESHSTVAPAPREAFDGSQSLALQIVNAQPDAQQFAVWLRDELEYWFPRAPGVRYVRNGTATAQRPFLLRLQAQPAGLQLQLIAPDGFVERRAELPVQPISLSFARLLAEQVPRFLGLTATWETLIGTTDANAYDVVTRARAHLNGGALDVTSHLQAAERLVSDIDALEQVTRRHRDYARAWSTVGVAYMRVEGEDSTSLATLAIGAADRAAALEPNDVEALGVRGAVQYRRGQWLAGHAQLMRALELQADAPFALEALTCLLVDAGLNKQALPIAERAIAASPASGNARECWSYARASMQQPVAAEETPLPFVAARLLATVQLLDGDVAAGRRTYETAIAREHRFAPWLEALMQAAADRNQTVEALRAITFAASEAQVDPTTEVLAGIALKRDDFVFNRLLRLQRAREYVPLRVLWLPQTASLRKHASFDDVLRASNLVTFWERHGKPDVCMHEPRVAACR